MAQIPHIDERERAVAALCRATMAAYRAHKAISPFHPAASDTRIYPWPTAHDVPEVVGLASGRATLLEVRLSAEHVESGDTRSTADELVVRLHGRGRTEVVINAGRSAQDTLTLGPLPRDIDRLLPVLRWACRQASEGSW
jgi:hypothetical protein